MKTANTTSSGTHWLGYRILAETCAAIAAFLVLLRGVLFEQEARNSNTVPMNFAPSTTIHSIDFEQEMDLQVVRTRTHFELLDVNAYEPRDITVLQGSNRDAGWDPLQPPKATDSTLANISHVVISNEAIVVRDDILTINNSANWILSFVAKRLRSSSAYGFDIVMGPATGCNCQIRFEDRNSLGIYIISGGYDLRRSSIPLPLDTRNEYHVITLMYTREDKVIKLYQDDQFVMDLTNGKNVQGAFAYIGSWYKQKFQANISLKRVYMAKTLEPLPSIQDFLMAKEFDRP